MILSGGAEKTRKLQRKEIEKAQALWADYNRMPGPSGNPTLESIVPVIKACADREKINPIVCVKYCAS